MNPTHAARARSTAAASALAALLALAAVAARAEEATGGPEPVQAAEAEAPTIDELADRLNRSERIVGGVQARPGQWPSMVALLKQDAKGRLYPFCGGTVIARTWVLTAAHCAAAMQKDSRARYFIREGSANLLAGTRADVPVSRIVIHENYLPRLTLNDVALLQLGGAAASPPQPLIGTRQAGQSLTPKRITTVVGFGLTSEQGSPSVNLLQVDVPVVSQRDCQRVYGARRITDATFCAGTREGGRDSCNGDSGGPSFVPTAGGAMAQAGIVSWGGLGNYECARPGVPGVYASVGRFEGWIRARVRDAIFVDGGPETPAAPAKPATTEVLEAIASGATTTDKPSKLAQLTVDIVQGNRLKVGETIDIRVLSSIGGTLALFNEEPGKRAYQIFPTPAMIAAQPGGIDRVVAGQALSLPPPRLKDTGFRFRITPPAGSNRLVAVVIPTGAKVAEILAQHADGSSFNTLDAVLAQLDAAVRGIEVVRLPPENRAVAIWNYEIVE